MKLMIVVTINYLRLQGHISANGNTYDGGVMHQFTISAHTNRYGADVKNFEFVGNSTGLMLDHYKDSLMKVDKECLIKEE